MPENRNLKEALINAVHHLNNNNLNECIEQLNEILEYQPNNIDSLSMLLGVYIKLNKSKESLNINKKLLEIEPNNKLYLEQRAKIYKFTNNERAYIEALEKLHKLHPSIQTARLISNLYMSDDDEDKSDNIIQSFLENDKNYSELYKGIRHVKAGRLKLAEETYKKILKNDKSNIDALRLLGLLAFKTKNYDIAENLFIKCLTLNPSFALAWDNLAKLYRVQNKLSKSIPAFENLIKLDSNNFEALVSFGTVYVKLSKYEDGIKLYKKALLINPENPRVYLSMGHALKTVGKREECEKAYKNAIKYFPLSGEAYWSLANLKTYKFNKSEISDMESAIVKKIHPNERIQMYFALGKAYESNKDFDKSFSNYKKGNWEQRKQIDYNAENYKISIDEMIDFFTNNQSLFSQNYGYQSNDPIFILGLPRSGSTLVEQILSSHSKIEGTQELPNIMSISRQIKLLDTSIGYPNNLLSLKDKDFSNYGNSYIDETRWARSSKPYFIDKMPNNFVHIGLIKLILPNAKIIDARRYPLDCCFSMFKQLFAQGQEFTYDLRDAGSYYTSYVNLMDHWNKVLPGKILTVNNEDVIDDLDGQVKRILNFIGLPFEENCISFYKTDRSVRTASSDQVRQPINKKGQGRWKSYASHLMPLVDSLDSRLLNQDDLDLIRL